MQNRVEDIKNNLVFGPIISASPAGVILFNKASGYRTTSLAFQQDLLKSSKSFTIAGKDIKALAAIEFSTVAAVISSYGISVNNPDLTGLRVSCKYSKLLRKTPVALVGVCKNILLVISENETALEDYNIDNTYRNMLTNLAKDLEKMTKLPKAIIDKRAADNKMYDDHEKMVKKFFDDEMDAFMEGYRKLNMSLYLAWLAARKVRHHHLKRKPVTPDPETTTGILELLLLFKDSMEAAAGVGLVIASLSISETSDVDGEIYIDALAPGTYHAKLSLEGYNDIEFDFTIEAGKTCSLQFLLEAV